MGKAKKESSQLDQSTVATLDMLIGDLENETAKLQRALDSSFSWASLLTNAENIYQLSGAIRDKFPESTKSDAVKSLCQHAYFVKHYTSEKNRGSIESNFMSLKIDIKNVKEITGRFKKELSDGCKTSYDLEFVKDLVVRGYIEESCQCLQAGAYRASIVMAGCALESMIRTIHRQTSKGYLDLPFSRIIDILEQDRTLQSDQAAIVNICRSFRNLTAHPSGYTSTKNEADSLLRLAVEQLKKQYS